MMGRVTAVASGHVDEGGSHEPEPDVDESQLEQAGPLVSVPRLQANPLCTRSACWVPLLVQNQMRGPEQRRRAPERAQRLSQWPQVRHKLYPYITQVRREDNNR